MDPNANLESQTTMKSFDFAGQNYTIGEMNGTECVWGTEAGESNAEVLDDISTWWAGDADQIEGFMAAAAEAV